jgi:hypothetical protein
MVNGSFSYFEFVFPWINLITVFFSYFPYMYNIYILSLLNSVFIFFHLQPFSTFGKFLRSIFFSLKSLSTLGLFLPLVMFYVQSFYVRSFYVRSFYVRSLSTFSHSTFVLSAFGPSTFGNSTFARSTFGHGFQKS